MHMPRALAVPVILAALVGGVFFFAPADAVHRPLQGTMVISPQPLPSGEFIHVEGTGFAPDNAIRFTVLGYAGYQVTQSDGSGNFSLDYGRAVFGPCTCVAYAADEKNRESFQDFIVE